MTEGRPIDRRPDDDIFISSVSRRRNWRRDAGEWPPPKWPTRRMCFHRCGCLTRNTSSWSGVAGPRRGFKHCNDCHRILSLICGPEILEMRASLKKNIDRAVGTRKCTKLWLRYLLNISTGDQSMRSRQPTQLTSLVGLDVRMMRPANLSLLSGRIKSQIVQSVGCTTSCRSLADVRRMLGEPIDFRPSERQSAPLLMNNKTRTRVPARLIVFKSSIVAISLLHQRQHEQLAEMTADRLFFAFFRFVLLFD